jgi:hypothetical protein
LNAKLAAPEVQAQQKAERKKDFHNLRKQMAAGRRGGDREVRQQRMERISEAFDKLQWSSEVRQQYSDQIVDQANIKMVDCPEHNKALLPYKDYKWCICKTVRYCCVEAQKSHWPTHKAAHKVAMAKLAPSAAVTPPTTSASGAGAAATPAVESKEREPRVEEVD